MSILIFILVLGLLIFVHELGHFILAKKTGMWVEEFAIGFPPRIFSFKKGETQYSVGLFPIGGFVKIHGEDYEENDSPAEKNGKEGNKTIDKNYQRRFTSRPKWAQAVVLVAGVFFNLLLAWVLISLGFVSGLPVAVEQFEDEVVQDVNLIVVNVLPDSPAELAGLEVGDALLYLDSKNELNEVEAVQDFKTAETAENFIATHGEQTLGILYKRGEGNTFVQVVPKEGIIEGKPAIGVSFGMIGTVKLSPMSALWEGLKTTFAMVVATAVGLFYFLSSLIAGTADLSQISGPVGIVFMVGDAFSFGLVYLLSFVALISINLAVINLLPVPALDGGRLLFILIEAIKGTPIKAKTANWVNLIGFAVLLLLMLVITFSDILKFF